MIEATEQTSFQALKKKINKISHESGQIFIVGPIKLPVQLDGETLNFNWYSWLEMDNSLNLPLEEQKDLLIKSLATANLAESQQSSVLVYGDFENSEEALIRMHSICHTGDIFGSKRCDCGFQLKNSMKMIAEHGSGALFYLANHEGRGIGLFSKAMAYILQEEGLDTVEANEYLGFKDDSRNYDEAIRVLKSLRQLPVTLITNNPNKLEALKNSGANVTGRIPLWGDISMYNQRYLETKMEKAGHFRGGYPI
ncbi:GTP cyclohydrolase II [Metabacillus litoralis]|uniref:GTP cyclohydrolase II n=1 Tax=Metabacillus litoralis TaxID=152268 RepID=A0A5C6VAG4_9BACI|nr:GTP cyclohydrolase II [Metabacillus litoralis]TXC81850.1 GTP cyclohydrolase II [Metabacillus litoralis]